jgi:predicted amidohydrolase
MGEPTHPDCRGSLTETTAPRCQGSRKINSEGVIGLIEAIKIGVVQYETFPVGEKEKNVSYILSKIEELAGQGIELIVFPELALTGFIVAPSMEFRRRYWETAAEEVPGPSLNRVADAAQKHNCYVLLGMAERSNIPMEVYNSTVLVTPKKEFYCTRKVHLPGLERMYFTPGPAPKIIPAPFGKIGVVICYDLFFPEITRCLAVQGAEIVFVVSSIWKGGQEGGIGDGASKVRLFESSLITRAIENQVYMVLCNGAGEHDMGNGYGIWKRMGRSKVVSGLGEIIAQTESEDEAIITATLTNEEFLKGRAAYTFFMDRLPCRYTALTNI